MIQTGRINRMNGHK